MDAIFFDKIDKVNQRLWMKTVSCTVEFRYTKVDEWQLDS